MLVMGLALIANSAPAKEDLGKLKELMLTT